jgi:hypothetical protein
MATIVGNLLEVYLVISTKDFIGNFLVYCTSVTRQQLYLYNRKLFFVTIKIVQLASCEVKATDLILLIDPK